MQMKTTNATIILSALLSAHGLVQAQAYKCKDSSGTVKYQQSPCSTPSEEKVRLFYDPNPDDSPDARDTFASELPPKLRARFDSLVAERKVAIGMTAGMVKRSWGQPKSINSSIRAAGRSEQWVYKDEYVYLENGRVTSIQTNR